jgi:D-psicose/D-tagatose/L-ribulose 3-epimerase
MRAMKYGIHCYLFVERWSDNTLSVLDQSKELGLDCVEIAVGDDVNFTTDRTAVRADSLGLELIVSPGGLWPVAADISSSDPTERNFALAWHKQQVNLAEQLNAIAYCGALYGHPGTVRKEACDPDEYLRTAAGLHQLAEYASEKGVAIVLEPMSHFRTHVANTLVQTMRLIELADHRNLSLLLDTYHLVTEVTDYADEIRASADRLWGLHACENNRGVPGRGLIPWDEIFRALSEIGFDGHVLLETYNSSIPNFASSRGMFHNVCPDGTEFVNEGLQFLRDGFTRHAKV